MANEVDEPVTDDAVAVAEEAPPEDKAGNAAEIEGAEGRRRGRRGRGRRARHLRPSWRRSAATRARSSCARSSSRPRDTFRSWPAPRAYLTAVVAVVVAFATAFALANWAIVEALSPSLPGWRAPARPDGDLGRRRGAVDRAVAGAHRTADRLAALVARFHLRPGRGGSRSARKPGMPPRPRCASR